MQPGVGVGVSRWGIVLSATDRVSGSPGLRQGWVSPGSLQALCGEQVWGGQDKKQGPPLGAFAGTRREGERVVAWTRVAAERVEGLRTPRCAVGEKREVTPMTVGGEVAGGGKPSGSQLPGRAHGSVLATLTSSGRGNADTK